MGGAKPSLISALAIYADIGSGKARRVVDAPCGGLQS
jgi:hypothetical protein